MTCNFIEYISVFASYNFIAPIYSFSFNGSNILKSSNPKLNFPSLISSNFASYKA